MPSCGMLPVALGPLDSCPALPAQAPPCPLRGRRPRRVLYPAGQSRRPPLREAPDRARRGLLLLSLLLFLQIYTEEAHTCTDLQGAEGAAPQTPEPEGGLCVERGWAVGEEPWRVQIVGGASEPQVECVVA